MNEKLKPYPNPAVKVRAVKALGWVTCGPVAFASMPFGSYEVEQLEEKLFVVRTRTGLLGVPFETEELARAAAQADYERRILSALTSPQGEETPAAPSQQAVLIGCEDGDIPCNRCAGTGNLIKDWDRYISAKTTEEIEDCESDCPDCSGYGRFKKENPSPQPRETPTLKAPDRDGGGE